MNALTRSTNLNVFKKCIQLTVTCKRFRGKEPRRKPLWMPMAPSKLFVIKQKPVIPEDEKQQIESLEQRYEIFMDSVRQYFKKEFYDPTLMSGGISEDQRRNELEEQEQLLLENEEENRRVAALRAEQNALQEQIAIGKFNEKSLEEELKKEEEFRKAREIVKREIKRSETYITKAKLEEAIESALLNPVHYEFAIDLQGNVHFDERLHPYALKPSAVPETSNVTQEFEGVDYSKPVKLEKKVIY
ncbi:hypothetical protein B4U80_07719 [Leptotrombidium deliense]|uniref:Small ribosomal subunit protein mS26 n=1 Tax=Leptotrombidium deliense TaxID=299467 RepID=A0A443SUJ3_9ACAR|nr:hypothetical protein B4U80_07719 [Leptotrombidium deliense]